MLPPGPTPRVVLTLTLSAMVAACSSPAAVDRPDGRDHGCLRPRPRLAASPTPAAAFPVTVTDDEGTAVEIAAEPETIVSLTPANTEILFALGAGDRVVATDDGSDYPGGGRRPARRRDIRDRRRREGRRLGAGPRPGRRPRFHAGRRDHPAAWPRHSGGRRVRPSVDAVYDDIELIGTATGTSDTATTLTADMRAEIESISAAASSAGTKPRVLYEVGYDDTTGAIYAPADDVVRRRDGDARRCRDHHDR